jgi:hypothetical protein
MSETRDREIHLETLAPMRVARCRAVSTTPEEDAAGHMAQWRAAKQLHGAFRHFGFDTDVNPEQARAGLRGYEVWTTVPDDVEAAGDVTTADFAGGLYAVMALTEPFADPFAMIPAGWQRLHEWVEAQSGLRGAGHQWLEELVEEGGKRDLVLFHPVARAEEAQPA